eukprot:1108042-Prorocentrum_lima.AAC.1
MMVVHSEEHAPTTIQELQPADVTFVGAGNILPRIAPYRSLIPQDLHLQICFRADGSPVER